MSTNKSKFNAFKSIPNIQPETNFTEKKLNFEILVCCLFIDNKTQTHGGRAV